MQPTQPTEDITEKVKNMRTKSEKNFLRADAPGETTEFELPPWLQQAQVMVPGNLLVHEPFTTIQPPTPPPVEVPLPGQPAVLTPSQSNPPESSTLSTTAPLVINGLLVATVARIMVVRPQMEDEALGILVVFLMASAIYISPYLRKYVPPIVRLIGGMMIGIIFNLALKYIG